MCHESGGWRAAPGTERVIATASPVVSLGWFSQHNGQPWLLVEHGEAASGGALGYVDWPTGTVIAIDSSRTILDVPSTRTQYVQNGNWCYCFSPYNPPFRWNGRVKIPVGFDTIPPAPTVVGVSNAIMDHAYGVADVNITPGSSNQHQRGVGVSDEAAVFVQLITFKYAIRCRYVNDLGMVSPASAIVWVEYTGALAIVGEDFTRKVSMPVQFPQPPAHVMAVQYYRSINMYNIEIAEGTEVPTYLVDELSPAEGRLYIDDHADSELGPVLDDTQAGVMPTRIRAATMWNGHFWFLTTSDRRLRRSTSLFVEQVPADAWYPLGSRTGGAGIALHPMRNCLVVLFERGIYIVVRSGDDYEVHTLSEEIGAACPEVIEVPGIGLVGLSDQGPFVVRGGSEEGVPIRVDLEVDKLQNATWPRVNRSALYAASASLHRSKSEVWFAVPSGGSSHPDFGLCYHYPSGAWSERHDYPEPGKAIRAMVETRDARADLFLGGPDGVYHVGDGYEQTRECSYTLGPLTFGQRSTIRDVELFAVAAGKHEVEIAAYIDRHKAPLTTETAWTLDTEQGIGPYEGPGLWGTAKWSETATWEVIAPAQIRVSLHAQKAIEHTLRISSPNLHLAAVRLQADPNLGGIKEKKLGGNTR